MSLIESEIASLFDEMSDEYDQITDLWYSWLFSNLHFRISKDLLSTDPGTGGKCLDIGCGTGFQAILFGLAGIQTQGIDISPALLEVARKKAAASYLQKPFFPAPYPFVKDLHAKTIDNINAFRQGRAVQVPEYRIASAIDLPFHDGAFRYVNCIGSVLSFLGDYRAGLSEMARVLEPEGYFFLEFENKYNPDLIWALLDSAIGGKIGYDQSFKESCRNLFSRPSRHLQIEFPFSKQEETIYMPIWIFNTGRIIREMREYNLEVLDIRSLHSVTNFIPSVLLDTPSPSKRLVSVFKALSKVEKILSPIYPFSRLGCSTYIFGRKRPGP